MALAMLAVEHSVEASLNETPWHRPLVIHDPPETPCYPQHRDGYVRVFPWWLLRVDCIHLAPVLHTYGMVTPHIAIPAARVDDCALLRQFILTALHVYGQPITLKPLNPFDIADSQYVEQVSLHAHILYSHNCLQLHTLDACPNVYKISIVYMCSCLSIRI
jgi:hypothetical protein